MKTTRETLSRHPLNPEWQALQWGIIILPFNPIISLLGLLFALFSSWTTQFQRIINSKIAKGWGILTLWLILTTLLADNKGEAALGLANFIPYFGLFLAYQLIINDFSRLRKLAWCLLLPSLPMSLLGLGQVYAGWHSPVWLATLGTNLIAGGRPEGRVSSLLMYANIFSAYLLMLFPLNLGLGIEAFKQWQRDKKQSSLIKVIGLGLLTLLNAIAIFLTDSRSAWGISLVIVLAFALYLTWYWLIGVAIVLVSMVAWASWGTFGKETFRQIVPEYIWGRLSDELYPDRYMTAFRSTQWDFAWEMMVNRPVFGWGLRNFTPLYQAKMNIWLGHPHNLPLMLLAEIGIPGTLLFLGLVGFILFQATHLLIILGRYQNSPRRQKEYLLLLSYLLAFASVSAYNLLDVTIFDIRVNVFGWVLLAAIAGITKRYQLLLKTNFNIGDL